MLKTVFRIKFEEDGSEAYLVINATHRSYYNLDGIIYAQERFGWNIVDKIGEVETADDFERLTASRPQVFVDDCRVCGRTALLFVDQDDGICVNCQGAGDEEEVTVN